MKERKGREGERMPHFNGSTANQSAGGQGQRQCTRARSRAVHVRSCCSNAWQSSASRWFSWAICRDFWRSSSMTERVYAMLLKAFSLHPRQKKKKEVGQGAKEEKEGQEGARRRKEEKGGERRRKEEKGGARRRERRMRQPRADAKVEQTACLWECLRLWHISRCQRARCVTSLSRFR